MSKLNDLDAFQSVPLRLKLLLESDEVDWTWEVMKEYWLQEFSRSEVAENNCLDCQYARIYPGCSGSIHEPPTPAEAECKHPQAEFFMPLFFEAAGGIDPEIAQHCPFYKKSIILSNDEEPHLELETQKPYCFYCGAEMEWDDTGCWNCQA